MADLTGLREVWAHGDGVNRGALIFTGTDPFGETGLCLSVTTDEGEAVVWLTRDAAERLGWEVLDVVRLWPPARG